MAARAKGVASALGSSAGGAGSSAGGAAGGGGDGGGVSEPPEPPQALKRAEVTEINASCFRRYIGKLFMVFSLAREFSQERYGA